MSKKDLKNVQADLSQLAGALPTQKTPAPKKEAPVKPTTSLTPKKPAAPKPKVEDEPTSQFSLVLRKSLRKELANLANESDMTMRAFVLQALKAKGLHVTKEDLVDRRKR